MIPPLKAIGRISGKHGYRGELNIEIDFDEAIKGLKKGNYLFVEFDEKGVPFCIESVSGSGKIIKLMDIDNEDAAQELAGKVIFLEAKGIPKTKKTSYEGLTGFTVRDSNSNFEGVIGAVEEYPQGLMLLVVNEGKSHLIPAVENWIEEIDEIKKVILMRLPEGLAEI